ncbi:DNA ligase 3 [Palaemon carinicauda]|uniref:DNA ligase 3 n=1 Tax=Palaemon carinicauda TaxID=392227 RepID=UPI0035B5DC53
MTILSALLKLRVLQRSSFFTSTCALTGSLGIALINSRLVVPYYVNWFGVRRNFSCLYYHKSSLLFHHSLRSINTNMSSLPFCAEYDKRGAAKCKKCKEKIEKGQLRIGKIASNPFSESGGDMKLWHHLECIFETFKRARATTKKIDDPYDDIDGFADLESDDKKKINELIDDLKNTVKEKATPKKQTAPKKTPQKQTPKKQQTPQKDTPQKQVTTNPKITKPSGTPSKSEDAGSSKGPPPPRNDPGMDRNHKDNSFREFRRICANVADEPSYLGKTDIVSKFLTYGSSKEKFEGDLRLWIKLLLPGVIKRVYNLQSKQLVKLFSQLFNSNQEEMLEDLENGDVAETVRVFFEKSSVLSPVKKSNLSIQDVDDLLEELSGVTKEEEHSYVLKKICKRCTGNDLKMVIRLIKGDLRINAGAKHILDAVHPDAYEAFQTTRNIDAVLDQVIKVKATGGSLKFTAEVMTPVLPMLAEACKSVDYAFKKCPSSAMYAEIKYDGERVQVHKKGNKFKYYSRSLKEVMPHKVSHFKDHIPQAFRHGEDLILDAEVLMIDNNTGIPLPFGTLGVHKKAEFQDANVCLFVFDCIHYNGQDLMDKPIRERREILEEHMTEIKNHIMFSEMKLIRKKEDLRNMINDVLKQGLEGLVLKDINSVYEPGKRHWLKVKKDYLNDGAMADTADLVVLGAWYGTGKKGGMMSVFLMGCFDKRINKWCTVTKVHTGHDDATLARLQNELDMVKISQDADRVPSWLKCTKPMVPDFVCADPKKAPVWEITGAEFTRHQIHTADGISIRFPRVTKIRDDKSWEEATSLSYLQELYKKSREYGDFEVLGSDADKIDDDNDDDGGDDEGKDSNSKYSSSGTSTPVKASNIVPQRTPSPSSAAKTKTKVQPTMKAFFKGSPEQPKVSRDKKSEIKLEPHSSKRKSNESHPHSPVTKKLCKYGSVCYNDNPAHLMMFGHPEIPRSKQPTTNPLPDFLTGVLVSISSPVEKIDLLRRYVIAYGGEILPEFRSSEATHIIGEKDSSSKASSSSDGALVSSDWLWDSIKLQKLLPTRPYTA